MLTAHEPEAAVEEEEDYLADYEPLTAPMQFRVGRSAGAGRGIFATEALPSSLDLLEEVPLVAWPAHDAASIAESADTVFCEACVCVFSRATAVTCADKSCGALLCSAACATGGHRGLCGGVLPALRRAGHCQGESVARCNVRIAQDVASFVTSYGLDAPSALANALRPWERFCTFPPGRAPDGGASSEALVDALRAHTLVGLTTLLEAHLSAGEAVAVAEELTSTPHVAGLLQRLQLNTIPWDHPRHGHLRFGGVFLLASNANHDCAPNMLARPTWSAEPEAGAEPEPEPEPKASSGEAACQGSVRDSFSLVLSSVGVVACGDELQRSYVGAERPLRARRTQLSSEWGFQCACRRCQAEEAEEGTEEGTEATEAASERRSQDAEVVATQLQAHGKHGKKRKAPSAPTSGPSPPSLVTRERPGDHPAVAQRVAEAGAARTGDWRYSVLPAAVPAEKMLQLSRDFFSTTGLLQEDGNTFGPEFEQQYAGHKNYFYYMNRNQVVAGAEKAGFIFEELDAHTRQVVELHHPGVPVRLERAFGAYYEGERDGFHLGVNEHCDGGSNLVSTIVHAVMPDGDVGFSEGGQLTVSEIDGLPAKAIEHTNDTVGDVVYLGTSVFHHAKPIKQGGRRLVFCMFYACDGDLTTQALAARE